MWLRARLDLFRDYCVPGLAVQTIRGFKWIVLLDARSPSWLCEQLAVIANDGIFEPVYLDRPFTGLLASELIKDRVQTSTVITTRVDNDDAVPIDFIERIQASVTTQPLHFINLVTGSQLADGKVYLRPYTRNPFISLVEPVTNSELKTVYVDEHSHLDRHGPIRNVRTRAPMWMQVVHGGNVGNKIVGFRIPGKRVSKRFRLPVQVSDQPLELAVDVAISLVRVLVRLSGKPARLRELALAATGRSTGTRQTP